MFPLHCNMKELAVFIDASRKYVDGYIGFYWGKTIDEYTEDAGLTGALIKSWLKYFSAKAPQILGFREPKHKQPLIRLFTHPPSQTSSEHRESSIEHRASSIESRVTSDECQALVIPSAARRRRAKPRDLAHVIARSPP